jgi:ketosteroid isomerase-like protein
MSTLLAATLFLVNTLDGRMIYVNPEQVISIAPPKDNDVFAEGVRCVISLADGKFVSAREHCDEVRARMKLGGG